jgi:hypothetical protein
MLTDPIYNLLKQVGMYFKTIFDRVRFVFAGGQHRPWLTEESPKAAPGSTF